MLSKNRLALACTAAAVAVAVAGVAPSALAAGSSHWSAGKCHSWQQAFLKRNPHASKARKAEGNRVLKAKGCKQRV